MKQFKVKMILLLFACLFSCSLFVQSEDFARVSSEQKAFELSVIWKELSYNFANWDNCPDINLDSLYRAYIPIVKETKNDFDYSKALLKFLSNFNHGHVFCTYPDYMQNNIAYLFLTTYKKDEKTFVDKCCEIYSLQKDDEILNINDLSISEYIEKFVTPYLPTLNKEKYARIDFESALNSDNEKLIFTIKRGIDIKKIEVPFICNADFENDTIKYQQIKDFYNSFSMTRTNDFLVDPINDFAYIKLTACDQSFHDFYSEKYDTILNYNNLILDLIDNVGGDGGTTNIACFTLTDVDSLRWFDMKTRINNAHYKAKATNRIFFFKPENVTQEDKDLYYPFFYNNAFEFIKNNAFQNPVPPNDRYKGNVYVLVNAGTASAAEGLILTLQLCEKVSIWGEKTSGALGQPLVIKLDSGIDVYINTSKANNIKGEDVSSGIKPDYEYDFSEINKISNPYERLSKYIELIKTRISD